MAVRRHHQRRDGREVGRHGRRAVVGRPAEVLEADVLRLEARCYLAHALPAVLGVVLLVVIDLERAAKSFVLVCCRVFCYNIKISGM